MHVNLCVGGDYTDSTVGFFFLSFFFFFVFCFCFLFLFFVFILAANVFFTCMSNTWFQSVTVDRFLTSYSAHNQIKFWRTFKRILSLDWLQIPVHMLAWNVVSIYGLSTSYSAHVQYFNFPQVSFFIFFFIFYLFIYFRICDVLFYACAMRLLHLDY